MKNRFKNELEYYNSLPKDFDHLALLAGGSILYGLDNETSDLDLRGVFSFNKLSNIFGLDIYGGMGYENFVISTDEVDASLYDLRKFLFLLRKTNTQVMEMIWANPEDFLVLDDDFKVLLDNKLKLIDTDKFYKSLRGYIIGEKRLMNGERTGRLGGKRKNTLETYGYSYKNLIQIIRLAYCGNELYYNGVYPINIKNYNGNIWISLMSIKNNPENYTKKEANEFVDDVLSDLDKAYEKRNFEFSFDNEFADDILHSHYAKKIAILSDEK